MEKLTKLDLFTISILQGISGRKSIEHIDTAVLIPVIQKWIDALDFYRQKDPVIKRKVFTVCERYLSEFETRLNVCLEEGWVISSTSSIITESGYDRYEAILLKEEIV